jgi:hypothetical protein
MNEQNFEYLKKQLKYTGFGETLEHELRQKMQEQSADFTLSHRQEFGGQAIEVLLYFKKSAQTDLYFFNRYFLSLKNEHQDNLLTQSFPVSKENTISLKEGFNLIQGRAVHKELTSKEGEPYQAWLQFNFKETDDFGNFKTKQFHQHYGYDLTEALAKYPIKELEQAETSQSLIRSLEKGNRQSVTMTIEGREQLMFIEANPQYKSLNIFTSSHVPVRTQSENQGLSSSQTNKPELKQSENKESQKTENVKQEELSSKPSKRQRRTIS